MRAHIMKKNPDSAVTRAGAETTSSWIDRHILQHFGGGKQVIV
jgi:hypothetical protein